MSAFSDAVSGYYLFAVAGGAIILFGALLFGAFQRRRRRQELDQPLPGEDAPH